MAVAVERAKQITMAELNAVMQVGDSVGLKGDDSSLFAHFSLIIFFLLNINNIFLMFDHLVNFANECKHIHKLAQACKSAFKHSFQLQLN